MNTEKTTIISRIILELIEQKAEMTNKALNAAIHQETLYQKVLELEKLYKVEQENNVVGLQLDKAYDRYEEALEIADKAHKQCDAISECIDCLRQASGIIEWLELY